MASLDNFHTGNGRRANYPGIPERNRWIQYGLHSSQSRSWDLPAHVPVAPTQPYDPGMRVSSAADPRLEERRTPRSDTGLYVSTVPRTQRRIGDTVEGIQLYDPCPQHFGFTPSGPCPFRSWWQGLSPTQAGREVPLQTYSRFHPYLR